MFLVCRHHWSLKLFWQVWFRFVLLWSNLTPVYLGELCTSPQSSTLFGRPTLLFLFVIPETSRFLSAVIYSRDTSELFVVVTDEPCCAVVYCWCCCRTSGCSSRGATCCETGTCLPSHIRDMLRSWRTMKSKPGSATTLTDPAGKMTPFSLSSALDLLFVFWRWPDRMQQQSVTLLVV